VTATRVAALGFSLWHGDTIALDHVALEAPAGRLTAVVGPSGSGKSSLLRAVNRLHDRVPGVRHEGTILVGDVDVYAPGTDPVALRRRCGFVSQRPNPFARSVFANVAYGPALAGERGDALDVRVEEALRRAALWDEVRDRLHAPAAGLSGGQQQRLCIARALANDPAVLLLDEPTSALDSAATERIEALLRALRDTVTILLVTHDLRQAARVSDVTAFLSLGRLVEAGPTERVFTSPRDPRTEAFVTGRFG
jgi:phosphate transport system ATP-binding protein